MEEPNLAQMSRDVTAETLRRREIKKKAVWLGDIEAESAEAIFPKFSVSRRLCGLHMRPSAVKPG
jgi:hypothetical protein